MLHIELTVLIPVPKILLLKGRVTVFRKMEEKINSPAKRTDG